MKTLHIIRHAKSSWNFDLDDHDRPLGSRGRRDVKRVASYLSDNVPTPQLLITSTASRALHTALFIADEWGYAEDQIELNNSLYMAGPSEIMEVISDTKMDSLAIFGHNPGLTSLINKLQTEYLDNLPTCGVYTIDFQIDSWKELNTTIGKTRSFIFPKKLK